MRWLSLGVAVAVVVFTVIGLRLFSGSIVQIVFVAKYRWVLHSTGDRRTSLAGTLASFRSREPFRALTDDDIQFLTDLFSEVKDGEFLLGKGLHEAAKRRSVTLLQDRIFLRNLVKLARVSNE